MRILSSVTPTPEQLKVLGDIRPGFIIIRGAAGSGKTTTALLRLREQIAVRLKRRQRYGHDAPIRVLVLTFNRTLEGYIAEFARKSAPDDDALNLEISTFARWARNLASDVEIVEGHQTDRMIKHYGHMHKMPFQSQFLVDEIRYILGRFKYDPDKFTSDSLKDYLTLTREGRGTSPRVNRRIRQTLITEVIPRYMDAKRKRGMIDWGDLSLIAANAETDLLYDVVIVDEAQDFSANQVRAILSHLQQSHSTTFVLDAVQRIYPQHFKWKEVGIDARPGVIYRLKENYRNTSAIAAFALPFVNGLPLDDDGTLPDFSACNRSGGKPIVFAGKYSSQLKEMLDRLEQRADLRNESVAILQPKGGGWFNEARRTLQHREIPYCELTRENRWPTGPEVVALCTIHSAKGLEFDHVLLPGLNQEVTPHGPQQDDANLDRLRRMLAMAIGRARKSVMLGYKPGEESSLINLLDPSTYKLVQI